MGNQYSSIGTDYWYWLLVLTIGTSVSSGHAMTIALVNDIIDSGKSGHIYYHYNSCDNPF